MPAPIPAKTRALVAEMLRTPSASVAEIAAHAGVSAPTVRRIAEAEGIDLPRGRPTGQRGRSVAVEVERERAIKMRVERLSIRKIADILGVSTRAVSGYLSDGEAKNRT